MGEASSEGREQCDARSIADGWLMDPSSLFFDRRGGHFSTHLLPKETHLIVPQTAVHVGKVVEPHWLQRAPPPFQERDREKAAKLGGVIIVTEICWRRYHTRVPVLEAFQKGSLKKRNSYGLACAALCSCMVCLTRVCSPIKDGAYSSFYYDLLSGLMIRSPPPPPPFLVSHRHVDLVSRIDADKSATKKEEEEEEKIACMELGTLLPSRIT